MLTAPPVGTIFQATEWKAIMLGEVLEVLVWLCIIVAIASFWGSSDAQRELDQKRKDNNKWRD